MISQGVDKKGKGLDNRVREQTAVSMGSTGSTCEEGAGRKTTREYTRWQLRDQTGWHRRKDTDNSETEVKE